MAYRSHSPLLLQIPTASPIEGYHSALKGREGKSHLQQFSLQGIAKLTDAIDQEWHKRAKIAAARFRVTVLPHLSDFPRFEVLSVPVQSMVADEIVAANNSLREGLDSPKELDDLVKCSCEFFRKYKLPCCQIFFQYCLFGTLTHRFILLSMHILVRVSADTPSRKIALTFDCSPISC